MEENNVVVSENLLLASNFGNSAFAFAFGFWILVFGLPVVSCEPNFHAHCAHCISARSAEQNFSHYIFSHMFFNSFFFLQGPSAMGPTQ